MYPNPNPNPNKDKLRDHMLELDRIAFWDETHKQCEIGGNQGNSPYQVTFPRDENGVLDPSGKVQVEKRSRLNVKYAQEIRLALGCAKTIDEKENKTGVVLTP